MSMPLQHGETISTVNGVTCVVVIEQGGRTKKNEPAPDPAMIQQRLQALEAADVVLKTTARTEFQIQFRGSLLIGQNEVLGALREMTDLRRVRSQGPTITGTFLCSRDQVPGRLYRVVDNHLVLEEPGEDEGDDALAADLPTMPAHPSPQPTAKRGLSTNPAPGREVQLGFEPASEDEARQVMDQLTTTDPGLGNGFAALRGLRLHD